MSQTPLHPHFSLDVKTMNESISEHIWCEPADSYEELSLKGHFNRVFWVNSFVPDVIPLGKF